ncbi:MAG: aminotransferase class I/II-fold pyridoxal phosphate-dependent enzyme, partial [Deltaproteobacteria bacterium]|nr:aminotransferase class I/II-fold pyridoxal phosphate-dependent enzyme [Deltaproteobacteria bacterium]
PIYESQIEFQGGRALPYGFVEGKKNFKLDMAAIEGQITPRTKILIFNDLQNPTGAECSPQELEKLAVLAIKHDLYVLCDEAYFGVRYEGESASLASLPGMAERSVILYSFSKKFAMTGWRLGAAIGPRDVIDIITKLNVNSESCSNHFIQYAGMEALTGDQTQVRQMLSIFKERRDAAADILNSITGVSCFRPNVTFYLYPNVAGAMELKGINDLDRFRKALLHETGVSVCTRQHFGRSLAGEKDFYLRLAYSGIDIDEIREGLGRFKKFIEG